MNRAAKEFATDAMLDGVRLVEALVHEDYDTFYAVVGTTRVSTEALCLALATILAQAAGQHPDPAAAIRDLRASIVGHPEATR